MDNMEKILEYVPQLVAGMVTEIITSYNHNWLYLTFAVLIAALMKVYIDAEKLRQTFLNKPKVSIVASVLFGAFTPLCACGTMAVVLGLLATALPWGPVMAFLTSSPLMSPDTFIMIAGVLDVKFAVALTIASLIIGFVSGGLTNVIEKKTNFLKNQLRITGNTQAQACSCNAAASEVKQANLTSSCGCGSSNQSPVQTPVSTCGCGSAPVQAPVSSCGCGTAKADASQLTADNASAFKRMIHKYKINEVGRALIDVGFKQILLYFTIFVALGSLIQSLVPTSIIMSLFSGNRWYSVPLAALIGLPLYVSGEGAIPLIKALMDGGAGAGAMMAFMITGPATSAWVIAGITAFMKKRVIALYVGYVFFGGIIIGYLYQFLITMGL
jgi:uncharacterized membrane protein YraQ (UPF0718 family)